MLMINLQEKYNCSRCESRYHILAFTAEYSQLAQGSSAVEAAAAHGLQTNPHPTPTAALNITGALRVQGESSVWE